MHVTQISLRTTLLFLDGHHPVPPTVPAWRVLDHCVDAPAVPHLGDTKLEKNINYLRILGEKIYYSYWIHHLERQVETGVKSMTDWYVKDGEKEPRKHVHYVSQQMLLLGVFQQQGFHCTTTGTEACHLWQSCDKLIGRKRYAPSVKLFWGEKKNVLNVS